MKSALNNLLAAIPDYLPEELFELIHQNKHVRIERIVSKGHSTPDGQWFDQGWDEWVLLLQGQAQLTYHQVDKPFLLKSGDYLLIPAHTLHRVEWTPPDKTTIWLAIHLL
ncbi:MAG: cupin domain-containing protein [Methylococcaceae bacterium]|nr:cupin domain-containing protein [Methylococcaceae bacterium]